MIPLVRSSIVLLCLIKSTIAYQNDYEPRVFDHIPLNCYDCLSYRDIILTQLTSVPARAFANFNLGSRDTNMILNGQLKLHFHPYAFQSLLVGKPNRTLTLTFTAPNSWLNITEHMFHGLELQPYSTLRLIIKFFYGCTFHRHALAGIRMGAFSRLIVDVSSITQVVFESRIVDTDDSHASIDFLLSRTDTIIFDSHSFSSLTISSHQILSFHFELISHIHIKPYAFQSLQLHPFSTFRFHALFLNRLTLDSFAFQNVSFATHTIFNLTIQTLGTCLCFKSHVFDHLHQTRPSANIQILFTFYTLRGLSFFPHAFSNLSLDHRLTIVSRNPSNDPNSIINLGKSTFSSSQPATIVLNFSSVAVIRFEDDALPTNHLSYQLHFEDVTLLDLARVNASAMATDLDIHFDHVRYVKWFPWADGKTLK